MRLNGRLKRLEKESAIRRDTVQRAPALMTEEERHRRICEILNRARARRTEVEAGLASGNPKCVAWAQRTLAEWERKTLQRSPEEIAADERRHAALTAHFAKWGGKQCL
jgi:hypothetical protein